MIRAQKAAFRYFSVVSQFPTLDSLLKRNALLNHLSLIKPSIFLSFARGIVKGRADNLEKEPSLNHLDKVVHSDMLGYFFAAKLRYPGVMTNQRISMYCLVNVVAGANNSALAMGRTMHYFAHNPHAWDRLYLDVLNTSGKTNNLADIVEPVTLDLALKSPYIEGVINESLRLIPTLSSNLERTVSSTGLVLSRDVHLPAGTNVAINTSAITRRKDTFGEDALEFNPLRWARRERESEQYFAERKARMSKCMLQFGAGSRGCIGRNVVILEMYKIWATLVRHYTVSILPKRLQYGI
jgi:cytochrome P450